MKKVASVLIINFKGSIIFIKRNRNLKNHPGEISFPGGMFDFKKDKDLLDTALRETYEEVGIKKEDLEVIGRLKKFKTVITNIEVHPFVANLNKENYSFKLNSFEVEEILLIPIKELINPKNKVVVPIKLDGKIYPNTFYYYKNNLIWGATSRILDEFLKNLNQLKASSGFLSLSK